MEIFKLFGSIFVNTDAADESMQKTESKAGNIASTLGKGIKTAAKWGAAIVAGATVAGTAIMGMANNVASTTDTIDKMSQKIGVSREAYQELDFICSQSGMSVSVLQGGMKTLTNQMQAAQEGTASAVTAFEKLGISIYDANGNLKSQETMMWEALSALQEMENQTEKAALANDLFGRSGSELMPLLNGATGSIEAMKQQAHDLGLVISDETVDAGVKFTDTMDQIKRSFAAIGTNLGGAVLPIVQQFAELLLANIPMIQDMIGGLAPVLMSVTSAILPPILQLAQEIMPIIMDFLNQLMPIFTQIVQMILPVVTDLLSLLLPPLMQIVEALLPVFVTVLQAAMPLLQMIIDLLTPIIQLFVDLLSPIISVIAEALNPLIEIIGVLMEASLKPLMTVITTVASVFGSALKGLFSSAKPIIDNIIGLFQGIGDFLSGVFTGNFEKAFSGLSKIVENIFGGIVELVKFPINSIIGLINGFISGLNKIKIPSWVPSVGGKGIDIPQIPKLYTGGLVGAGQLISTNEYEPELIGNYGKRTLVMNNAQIIDTMVGAISATMESFIAKLLSITGGGDPVGDIIIPVYVGQEYIDEMVISAQQRNDYRSGGR